MACRAPLSTSPSSTIPAFTGRYDFTLDWTPDETQFLQFGPRPAFLPPRKMLTRPPPLNTAIQEQLGLKIESGQSAS